MTIHGQQVTTEWVQVTPDYPRKRRIIAISGGMEKTGKTTFAASAPDPLYSLGLDRGAEVISLHSAGREIYLKQYIAPRDLQPNQYTSTWEDFKATYYSILNNNRGSLLVDTETAMYELIRLARFGKLTQVMPEQYGPLNAELNSMMDAAFESDMTVVMIRRAAPVYSGRQATGQWEDRGWSQMPYVVEMRVWTYRCAMGMCQSMNPTTGQVLHAAGDGFHARVRDSRWKPDLVGTDWSSQPPYLWTVSGGKIHGGIPSLIDQICG